MISVIIPIYNAENYIEKCLMSVAVQTYEDFEVLLIDDGSSDNSAAICKKYEETDNRFVYRQKKNGGVSSARNYGIDLARGELITFVDSDDTVSKDYLRIMYDLYKDKQSDLVVQGLSQFSCGKLLSREVFPNVSCRTTEMDQNLFCHLVLFRGPYCKLFKHEIIKLCNILFPENISYGEDALFYYEYLLRCKRISFSDYCGYNYIIKDSGSLSTTKHDPEKLYYFYRDRTRQIRLLQQQYKQDKYPFPHLSEKNLYGLKTIISNMKFMNYSVKNYSDLIKKMKEDGFFKELKATNFFDSIFLRFIKWDKLFLARFFLR